MDIHLTGVIVYVSLLVAVGVYRCRSVRTQDDFMVADRVRRLAQYTLSDILEQRYNAAARILATLTITVAAIRAVNRL